MSTKTISVYEALQQKKILNNRISKKYDNGLFVTYATQADTSINGIPLEDVQTIMKSNYKSINQLIKNAAAYTAAINQSNAVTTIEIAEKTYTVAEAIARYQSIDNEIDFVNTLLKQYNNVQKNVEENNTTKLSPERISNYIANILGDSKKDEALIDSVTDRYKRENTAIIIDPNDLANTLQKKKDDIINFKEQFHFALTRSNAMTNITVELED